MEALKVTRQLQFSCLHSAHRFSTVCIGGLAQLVEQLTLNQRVTGSSPVASTPKMPVFTTGNQQTKEGFAKSQIPAGSNINGKSIPKSQSPREFSQGNKHQPQNNLTTNDNAKSNSLNSNSSAGSQGTVKHQNFTTPAGGHPQKRNRQ